jgi:dihydroorotate dehydrogenase electron transfer subunit
MHDATVMSNRTIVPGILRMRLACPDAAQRARPGQFIMLQVSAYTDPLLRRPFSVCSAREDVVDIVYKVVGRGTAAMAAWQPGLRVSCIGPRGNGFSIADTLERAYLVAGGMGIAPLLFLLETLKQSTRGASNTIFIGGKTAQDIAVFEDFNVLTQQHIFYATEDASRGFPGLVTDLFANHLKEAGRQHSQSACIYGCGPAPMLSILGASADHQGLECQVSLESRMACGIGACLGCAVKTKASGERAVSSGAGHRMPPDSYKRVCADGPVFNSRELVWDV